MAGRVLSLCEVHLMDERARKNAEMPAFNSNKWLGWQGGGIPRYARDANLWLVPYQLNYKKYLSKSSDISYGWDGRDRTCE